MARHTGWLACALFVATACSNDPAPSRLTAALIGGWPDSDFARALAERVHVVPLTSKVPVLVNPSALADLDSDTSTALRRVIKGGQPGVLIQPSQAQVDSLTDLVAYRGGIVVIRHAEDTIPRPLVGLDFESRSRAQYQLYSFAQNPNAAIDAFFLWATRASAATGVAAPDAGDSADITLQVYPTKGVHQWAAAEGVTTIRSEHVALVRCGGVTDDRVVVADPTVFLPLQLNVELPTPNTTSGLEINEFFVFPGGSAAPVLGMDGLSLSQVKPATAFFGDEPRANWPVGIDLSPIVGIVHYPTGNATSTTAVNPIYDTTLGGTRLSERSELPIAVQERVCVDSPRPQISYNVTSTADFNGQSATIGTTLLWQFPWVDNLAKTVRADASWVVTPTGTNPSGAANTTLQTPAVRRLFEINFTLPEVTTCAKDGKP
jgi:hypothetical protein